MTEEVTEAATPEPRVVKPAALRLLLYRLTLDWIGLRQSLPVPSGSGGRSSNVRTYAHPAEWASDQCDLIANLFFWWHQELAEKRKETRPVPLRQMSPDPHTRAASERAVIVAAWKYLEPRIEELLEVTDPETEPFQQAFDLHGQIRARLGLSQKQWTLPIPCPNDDCNLLTLQRIAGINRDYVICGACDYYIDAEYYPLLVRMALDTLTSEGE